MDDSAAGGELVAPDVRVAAIAVRGHLLRPARRPREHVGRLRREPPFWAGERTAHPYVQKRHKKRFTAENAKAA